MYLIDKLITDPNDELYDLQAKYNVKINRSCSSDAVYIFQKQKQLYSSSRSSDSKEYEAYSKFVINVETQKVTKDLVEKTIQKYSNRF